MLKVFVKIKKIQEIAEQGASPERARVLALASPTSSLCEPSGARTVPARPEHDASSREADRTYFISNLRVRIETVIPTPVLKVNTGVLKFD